MSLVYSNRREFLRVLIGGAAGLSFTYPSFGQGAPDPITATKLSDTVVLLSGDGGNVAVIMAADGLMLVDAGLPERADDLLKAAGRVDSHKITTLFNTHWHFDHIGANEALGKSGAKIIAHENVKTRLSARITVEALNRTFDPLKPEGLPRETFAKGGKMTFGKEPIEYTHAAPAHTDGDSYLFFSASNVLHTGDLYFNGMYPFIDYSTGGWIGGMIAACDTMLKIGDAKTRIIPGHGPLGSKDDMKTSRDVLTKIYERMAPMAKQGKSADEVVKAAPTKEFDEKWGKGFMTPEAFVRDAYTSIVKHNQKA